MSTNKTQHYKLHSWTANDSFRRTEINENFQALDVAVAGKCEMVVGGYRGNGSTTSVAQFINLGRRPKAVMIWDDRRSGRESGYAPYHGMAVEGYSGAGAEIVDGGFKVHYAPNEAYPELNSGSRTYMYMAFFAVE